MAPGRGLRRLLLAGALTGAAMGIALAIFMDTLYADSLGGTWLDAIKHDLDMVFSADFNRQGMAVKAVFGLVLSVLALFGAAMGYVFSFIIYKFFGLLRGE